MLRPSLLQPHAPPAHPASFANGRYAVKRFLGEGGKKRVYLAHDTVLDRDVAFALIKTEGLDDVAKTRITREAQAMGRLGDHPHIMPIYDLGSLPPDPLPGREGELGAGQPYMVLTLMGGGDVEGVVKKAPQGQVPLERTLEIAKAVAKGLAFAHGKNIVHRDIKPGNVWLTGEGIPKIGDFGLAVASDNATRLTTEGMMVGTVADMPPEQALGGEITPKADLYSLGAMLYEMVTGRPPFLGDDAVSIISQHINVQPVAPTWHNAKCPKPLEALILRLLAKDPKERPASASDVLKALEGMDLTPGHFPAAGDGSKEGVRDRENALDGVSSGVFVGRQKEMRELKAALEDALSGKGRLLTLVGEPGIGKTRTASELATYAGLRQAQVLWGRSYEAEGVPPYWPWVQALRAYVREHDPAKLRTEMGSGAAEIAEIVSDVRERLPDLKPSPAVQDPEAARFRLFDSVTSFLKTASRTQPLVVVLDDLHWADKPSLLLLEFVARELTGARLLVIGTYRDMELNRQHPLSQTLGELARERLYQRVLLRGLTQEDVGRFVQVAAGITPPADLVKAVYTQTEGNHFFVTEVVRLLVQEGQLSKTATTPTAKDSWTVRIPEGVREVIGRRLDRLSARCSEALTNAAIIGREFGLDQLTRLMGDTSLPAEQRLSEDMLLGVIEEALAARVIEELPKQVGRYQFTHALIQETLAGELSTTRRSRLHARIATMLEALYGAQAEAHAAELAEHFAEAQTLLGTEKYRKYATLAGQRAEAAFAWEEAVRFYQGALATKEGQTGDPETADLQNAAGRTRLAVSTGPATYMAAWNNLKAAFDWYVATGDLQKAVSIAAIPTLSSNAADADRENDVRPRALKLVPADSIEAAQILAAASEIKRDVEDLHRQALATARRYGNLALQARLLNKLAMAESDRDIDGSVEMLREAIDTANRAGALLDETRAHRLLGARLVARGLSAEGRENLVAAARLDAKTGWRESTLATLSFLTALHAAQGEWHASHEILSRQNRLAPGYRMAAWRRALYTLETDGPEAAKPLLDQLEAFTATIGAAMEPAYVVYQYGKLSGGLEYLALSRSGRPINALQAALLRGLLALLNNDEAEIKDCYRTAPRVSGRFLSCVMASDRFLGALAKSLGELDQAAQHFEDAIAFCRKAGYRPELAWSLCDYADLLQQRDGAGDRFNTAKLLEESLRISSELGMKPLMERVLARRKILKA